MNICIVGLGYVDCPLLCQCARKGHKTFGYDIKGDVLNKLRKDEKA